MIKAVLFDLDATLLYRDSTVRLLLRDQYATFAAHLGLSFANTSSDSPGDIRDPRLKGVSQIRGTTLGILTLPTGRGPSRFAIDEQERAGCCGPVTCALSGQRTDDTGLGRLANVAMVQAADFRKLYDLACRGELDRPEVWSVLVEREMGTRPVVVSEVSGQDAAEVSLAENEHVTQAFAPD